LQFASTYNKTAKNHFERRPCPELKKALEEREKALDSSKPPIVHTPQIYVLETIEKDYFVLPRTYRYYVIYPFASNQHETLYKLNMSCDPIEQQPNESGMLSKGDVKAIRSSIPSGYIERFFNSPCAEVLQEMTQQPDTSMFYEILVTTAQIASVLIFMCVLPRCRCRSTLLCQCEQQI